MAKDYLGTAIEVGDEIIFVTKNYREFRKGVILKITAKMLVIAHEHPGMDNYYLTTTKQFHDQVIKVPIG